MPSSRTPRPRPSLLALMAFLGFAVSNATQSHAQVDVLFVGNSFTNGYVEPALSYNDANVTDANGSGLGGVPGIFKAMATAGGHSVNVTIETINGSTLNDHRTGKAGIIAQSKWEWVILQDLSTRPLSVTGGDTNGGNLQGFRDAVLKLRNMILTANPSAKILLFETWARPNMVPSYFPTLQAMRNELRSAYSNAAVDFGLFGWVPVGSAFVQGVEQDIVDDPEVGGSQAPFSVWHTDGQHAQAYGSYLTALMFYGKIFGDPRTLPTGSGSVAEGLSLNGTYAAQLADLAWDMLQEPVVNHAPVSYAGADAAIALPSLVANLNGLVQDDQLPEGSSVTSQWSFVSGPSAAVFGDATLADTTVTFPEAGVYVLRLTATDGTLESSDDVTITVTDPALLGQLIDAVNCGKTAAGAAFLSADDGVTSFVRDTAPPAVGGQVFTLSPTADIDDTSDDLLFQTYRYGSHSYRWNVSNGDYVVTLRFADGSAIGARVFDVAIEGNTVLNDFDIVADAGAPHKAISRTFNTTVSDGQLNVAFTGVIGTAKVNAIVVRRSAPALAGYYAWVIDEALTGNDAGQTADPDRDGRINLEEYFRGSDPWVANGALDQTGQNALAEEIYLQIAFSRNVTATDVNATVRRSGALGAWTTVGTITGGVCSGAGFVEETGSGNIRQVKFRDTVPMSAGDAGFLRLEIARP